MTYSESSSPATGPSTGLSSLDSDMSTEDSRCNKLLLSEMPYYPNKTDPLVHFETSELMMDGNLTTKLPVDGFISFYSLKFCSSNARQTAKFLQLAFGFEPVAYRGLENDSRFIGSHVLKNGEVYFEVVNTLEAVEDDPSTGIQFNFKEISDDFIFDLINCKVDFSKKSTHKRIYQKITTSKLYRKTVEEYNRLILDAANNSEQIYSDIVECNLIQKFLKQHGEGIMDISFKVLNVQTAFDKAVKAGAGVIRFPRVLEDSQGSVKLATISVPQTDIQHTLIEFVDFRGQFLPNYANPPSQPPTHIDHLKELPPVPVTCIDHCVENYSWNQMMPQAKFYAEMFGFHKFWSVDETDISTENSALRSIVMALSNGKIKMPINEPAKSKMRSQIEEFHDFNGGPGVQHVALRTNDIIKTVTSLIIRGVEFNRAPSKFHESLKSRLLQDGVELHEDIDMLRDLGILVDYDALTKFKNSNRCNYILQVFTKPLHDRPTLFIEIIQRYHHNGFGKGTFKGLFESIEEQQKLRGTFVPST